MVVRNVITAKTVNTCEAVVRTVRTNELLVNGTVLASGVGSYYFANGGTPDGFTLLLPMREVSESYTGLVGPTELNTWPTQFSGNQTNWEYTTDNGVGLRDGAVGAYLKWSNILINAPGVYSFRSLYYYTNYDPNATPLPSNNESAIIQMFVDGVAASATFDTSTVATPGQPNYFLVAIMDNVVLTEGVHQIEVRVVGMTPAPGVPGPLLGVGFVLGTFTAIRTADL
jgi:hypothetical protein